MTPEQRKELLETAKQMPIEAVRTMETSIKKFFGEDGVPYNVDTLRACLVMNNLIHAGLPPVYGQFTASAALLLLRLIEENDTGLVGSPIHVERKNE